MLSKAPVDLAVVLGPGPGLDLDPDRAVVPWTGTAVDFGHLSAPIFLPFQLSSLFRDGRDVVRDGHDFPFSLP